MLTRRAMCLPLGLGACGEETSVSFDGRAYRCVPFQIDVSSCQVWDDSKLQGSARFWARDLPWPDPLDASSDTRTVMVHVEHRIHGAMRDLVGVQEAETALTVFGATVDDVAAWEMPWSPEDSLMTQGDAMIAEAYRIMTDADLTRVSRLLRAAGRLHGSYGDAYPALQGWRSAVSAELAEVLGRPTAEIDRLVYPSRR